MKQANGSVLDLIRDRALVKGVEVKLASGQSSNFYVDCKRITLHGPSLKRVGEAFWARLKSERPTLIAGVSVGGDPLVAAILIAALQDGVELSGLLVRKEKKSHGLAQGRAVDGPESTEKDSVWLVEDVISTGGSSLKAAEHLVSEGYKLKGILSLVDREMGGIQSLGQKFGVPVISLHKISEIGG